MTSDVCVKLYFRKDRFQAICLAAEKAGFRRAGLPVFTQKPNGFAGEMRPNSDGVARFLKVCAQEHEQNEAIRLREAATIKEKEMALQKEKEEARKRGIII